MPGQGPGQRQIIGRRAILRGRMHPTVALLLTLVMVLANAFFVAAEFAFVKIRPTRLQQLAREGDGRARLLLTITPQLPAYLSASQLGITLASLTLGWLGEPAFVTHHPAAAATRAWTGADPSHTLAAAISLTLITFMHTVLGELAPKALAIQRTESIALWAAVPFRGLLPGHVPAHLDAEGRGQPGAAHPAPAARVGGGDAALAR